MRKQLLLRKVKFYSSALAVHSAALLFLLSSIYFPLANHQTAAEEPERTVSVAVTQPATKQVISGKPARIQVFRLGIDLPVLDGSYDKQSGTWTLGDFTAHFALVSTLANDTNGNTFIYGHNNKRVFGPLKNLVPGDTVQLTTDNGHAFTYVFQHSHYVRPGDTDILRYQGPPILTIQTCSGIWNEKRQLFSFSLQAVST